VGLPTLAHPDQRPRWSQKSTHPYSIETISQTTKIAFFTGLRQVGSPGRR
jgi:hypothetical protein